MQFAKVIVKKYENRRLYDTSNSRYVNLDDIAEMVRDGSEVQVINAVTGQDLTRLVMTQIVVESAKVPDSGFPLDLLRQMVIASGRASREGLLGYMKAMFDMYQNAYRTFTSGIAPFDPGNPNSGGAPATASATDTSAQPPSQPQGEERSIDKLYERIAELERLLSEQSEAQFNEDQPLS